MKYHQNLLILIIACSLSMKLSAQRFYVTFGDHFGKVGLSPSGCTYTKISTCYDAFYYSITLFKNKLYYVQGLGLYESTLVNGRSVDCKQLTDLPILGPTSLTVDSKGVLYFALEYRLFSYDPASKTLRDFGTMPFNSAGDLVFYEGTLYMAAGLGIVRVDTSDVTKSTLEVPVIGGLYGLASLSTDCNQNKLYAFSAARGGPTDVIEIDLVNKREAGVVCTIPGEVFDAASDTEAGGFLGIEINRIDISSMCDKTSFGQIVVVPEPTLTRYSYSLDGGTPSQKPRFANVSPGSHTITITTPGGCRLDTTVHVPVYNVSWPAIKGFKEDVSCIEGGKVWFTMPVNDPGYWIDFNKDTFSIRHSFEGLRKGDYAFKIHDQFNCLVDSQQMHLLQLSTCDTLYFPNAFTPNSDGRNDVFRASQNFFIQSYALTVYNRWGQMLFQTDDITKGWTGRQGSREAPMGVYIWTCTYNVANGTKKLAKGTVVLIR
jgi:gliding motility-associated-like protein